VEIYVNERPSAPPAALARVSAGRVRLAAGVSELPRAHSVQIQAGLVQSARFIGRNGTTVFTGNGSGISNKRMDVRGVPPRGRPV
jgi:hypothetical protein